MSDSIKQTKPHYYGWVIVLVAALAMLATLPGRTHGLGLITERLLTDPSLELDQRTYGTVNLVATLVGALFCLPCGTLIDRFGLRLNLTLNVLALAAVVLWMTRLTGFIPFCIAIVLTRGFGQSALSVVSITMVGKWFRGRLGVPMSVYSLLIGLGFFWAFRTAKDFAQDDWRVLWGGIGWLLLIVMAPIALLLTRDPRTAEIGPLDMPQEESATALEGFTLRQAMQTPAFWVFGLSICVVSFMSSGMALFNESILTKQGFPKEVMYDVLKTSSMAGLLAQLPMGWLVRQYSLARLQGIALLVMSGCLFVLPLIHTESGVTAYAIVMGVAGTTTTLLFFTIWGQAYGRAHLGQIQAVAQMLTVLASAAGPKVLAECNVMTGSYVPALRVLSGLFFVLAIAAWFVRVPRPEEAPRSNQQSDLIAEPLVAASER